MSLQVGTHIAGEALLDCLSAWLVDLEEKRYRSFTYQSSKKSIPPQATTFRPYTVTRKPVGVRT